MGRYDLDRYTVTQMLKDIFKLEALDSVEIGCCSSPEIKTKIQELREVVEFLERSEDE